MSLTTVDVDGFAGSYLRRLGLGALPAGDLGPGQLRALHAAHLERVPFENLSIHLGEPLSLEPDALADKILARGRGGFCYELNGTFGRLLESIGYRVTLLGAQVCTGSRLGPPLDHLVLRVSVGDGEERWLVDIGFGDHCVYPVPWREGVDWEDPGGVFRLTRTEDGDLDVCRDGKLQYRIDPHPRVLSDFNAMCWYQAHAPLSHFTRSLVCSRRTPRGRVTLSGRRLVTTTADGRDERDLAGDEAVLEAYRTVFGIVLERVPVVAG